MRINLYKVQVIAIISIVILLCGYSIMAQNNRCTFIRHDSIPMILADSVVDFYGRKIAAKDLNTHKPLYYYAALTPDYPIEPIYTPFSKFPDEVQRSGPKCFKVSGGLVLHCINYQACINGDTILINSHKKFRELFAPVESEQEAIAFAYIFTDSKPMYHLDFLEPGFEKYTYYEREEIKETRLKNGKTRKEIIVRRDSIMNLQPLNKWFIAQPKPVISSYVKKVDDGYELLLYHYAVFGCSHPYMRRLVKVTFDGHVEIMEEYEAFGNIEDLGLCVD